MIRIQSHRLILPVIILIFAACVPQTPIPVYITPTPDGGAVAAGAPSVTPSTEPATPVTAVPTEPEATPSPVVTAIEATTAPDATIMGPVVGPDYTLQPTRTPRASATPTPSITPTIGASATPTGPSPTPLPGLRADEMGIQLDWHMGVDEWAAALFRAQTLKVGWVKMQAAWSFLQPDRPNQFDQNFRLFEIHVEEAKKRGFKVMISIAKAPPWARSNREQDGPPDDPQLLVNLLNFMLNQTKIGPSIDAVEIWNEPNLVREWTGTMPFSGGGYMRLFASAYNAIRAYSPSIAVVTAGLAPTGDSPWSVDDRTFLQQMYNAGLRNYQDISVGVHPYSWGNPPDVNCCNATEGQSWDDDPHFFFADNIDTYRTIMVNNGQGHIQMWATEFGWASWEGFPSEPPEQWFTYNSRWDQGNYTIRAFQIGQERDYIGPMILWNLNFATEDTINEGREISGYSIFIPILDPPERPLYRMLEAAVQPAQP